MTRLSAVYSLAVGAECHAEGEKTFVLYSTNGSYFFIGSQSDNTDLLNSIYPAGSILNISIKILQYFSEIFIHLDTSLT